jgi:hypothetical protein
MSRTMLTIGLATLIAMTCSGTRGTAADLPVPRPVAATANTLAVPTIDTLAEAIPDGVEVAQLYLKSMTVNDITAANQRLEEVVSKVRSSEAAVNKLYEAAMRSCDHVDNLVSSNIETIVTNVRRLDKSLADIDMRLKHSVETMRQSLGTSGSGILLFRTGAELRRFESAYGEYARLRLSIHELANGLGSLARDLPKAQQFCKPLAIPPLNAEPSSPPTSRTQQVTIRSVPAIRPAQTGRGTPSASKTW